MSSNRTVDVDPATIRYAHRPLGPGWVTLAWVDGGDPTAPTDLVHYAVSYCSPQDQFCKRTGRLRAAGRLRSKVQSHVIEVRDLPVGGNLMGERIARIIEAIMARVHDPAAWAAPSTSAALDAARVQV